MARPDTPQSFFYGYVYAKHTNASASDNPFLYDVRYLIGASHLGDQRDFYEGELSFGTGPTRPSTSASTSDELKLNKRIPAFRASAQTSRRPDPDLAVTDGIFCTYTGEPFPFRQRGRVVLVIEADDVKALTLPFAPPT